MLMMKSTAVDRILDVKRPLPVTLRDQIAMSVKVCSQPYDVAPNDRNKTNENMVLAEWRERYRLADLIIKESR
jgi:hypothetical protein